MIHPDLPHGGIIGNRRGQNRKRQSYMIIQVPFRLHHAVADGKDARRKLLRAGLAAASRDADHLQSETIAPGRRQPMEGDQRVIDEDDRKIGRRIDGRVVNDGPRRASRFGLLHIGVPIVILAAQR